MRVVKVGGSLLSYPALAAELRDWLRAQRRMRTILVAGAGSLADRIRHCDSLHQLGESTCHWLCIDSMSITAKILTGLLPDARLITRLEQASEESPSMRLVFDCAAFLRDTEPHLPGERLPQSWDVTSDSIAARLAEVLGADELVLLKSALPAGTSRQQAVAAGFVDAHFAVAALNLPLVRCVNLRSAAWDEVEMKNTRGSNLADEETGFNAPIGN